MAKKLVFNYTFTPGGSGVGNIVIGGIWSQRNFILITNVTDGTIIYNFADPGAGASNITYNSSTDETTLTLVYNTSSMSSSDELQILLDDASDTKIDAGESLIDPVHKLRVSNPQNLIDTDFEYGLQPTKWETVELVDNIPSVYTRSSGVSIGGIAQVQSVVNSDVITVTCTVDHDLSLGDPIEVQGCKSRTVNGKYLVTSLTDTRTFTYRAGSVQNASTNQATAYTTIIPGSFFSGSDIKYNTDRGIETNNSNPSTLTFETSYKHGLSAQTSLYLTNTVGKQTFTLTNTSSNAADGSAVIDSSDETIYVSGNNFYTGQPLFVTPGSGGSLPTLTQGAPEPYTNTSIQKAYDATVTACNTIIGNMSFHANMLVNYNFGQNYAFYCDGQYFSYTDPVHGQLNQQLRYGNYDSVDYFYFWDASNFQSSYRRYNYQTSTNDTLYTGLPVDIGAFYSKYYDSDGVNNNTTSAGNLSGFLSFISTPFVNNSLQPYIIQVEQLGDFSVLGGGSRGGATRGVPYKNSLQSKRSNYFRYRSYDFYSEDETLNSLSSGWVYQWAATQYQGRWLTGWPGYLGMTIRMENSNFTYNRASVDSWLYSYTTSSYLSLGHNFRTASSQALGSSFIISVLIPYYPSSYGNNSYYGFSGSELTFAQMANTIATEVASQLSYATSWPNPSGENEVRAVTSTRNNRITLRNISGSDYSFANSGTGPIIIETGQVSGAVDNYYNVSSVTPTTVNISATSQINPRTLEFTNSEIGLFDGEYYIHYQVADGHGLTNATPVTFNVLSGTAPTGLVNGGTYYAIVDDNEHFRLASSVDNANSGVNAMTSAGSGSFNVQVFTVNGRSSATGLVTTDETSQVVTGSGTKFTSTYKIGDTFSIVSAGSTVNQFIENTVISVVNDTSLTLAGPAGVTTSNVAHYVDTKINVRADGEFLHRPFDGGVDITAGTSPDSSIVRQTRKYFRYQSGKGIQCSMAINFNPARPVRSATGSGTAITMETEYPHGLVTGNSVKITGASDNAYNGTFTVTSSTAFTFNYTASSSVSTSDPSGFIDYAIQGYTNAGIRAGLFDFQNGFFFEYNGQDLYAVRRSAVQQLSGTVTLTTGENIISGDNTKFTNQLSTNDRIVIRGQTYKITAIESNTEIHVQPSYRGTSATGAVVTKVVDTKVAQSNWNIDKADGTGPSGYLLDINKIQMVYMDYSWYGAGKIRFGFKDTYGHVKYMHEFIHNNKLNEAYMRSGNIPARYEVFNEGIPSYVPSLFHWGTSVIMDGGFDDDDSYLFTASGNTLTFTNGDSATALTTAASSLISSGRRFKDYYVQIPFSTNDAAKFTTGIGLWTADGQLSGQTVSYTAYGSSIFYVYVYVSSGYSAPASYPVVANGTTVNIGAETAGSAAVDLNSDLPLISVRLAPSVDNNLIGALGARDVINRMQLKLRELGVSISHDAEIKVILNGSLSNLNYANVGSPSLTQYIPHVSGDTVSDGITIYKFRASGGSTDITGKRLNNSQAFDLSSLVDLGNSILGGDDVFPNGPDIITITASVINTAEIDSQSSFQVASRLSWAESQA